jgi:hypothetical protein
MNAYYEFFQPHMMTKKEEQELVQHLQPFDIRDDHQSWWNTYVKKNKFIALGTFAVNTILAQQSFFEILNHHIASSKFVDTIQWGSLPIMDVWVDEPNLEKIIEDITKACQSKETIITSKEYVGDFFIPKHVIIYYNKRQWITLISSNNCISFNHMDGFRIGTLHSILRVYLGFYLSPSKMLQDRPVLKKILGVLVCILLHEMAHPSKKKLLKLYTQECYGKNSGLVTLKRQRYQRIGMQKRNNKMASM